MAIPLIPLLFMTLMSRSFEPGTFMGENGSTLCLAIAFALLVVNYAISKPNVKSLPTIIDAFENGGKNCLSVGIACGMAGIIAGVVTMTGLGQVLIGAAPAKLPGHRRGNSRQHPERRKRAGLRQLSGLVLRGL